MATDKRFGEFENEHLFGKALFVNTDVERWLNGLGIYQDMPANRINLFSNEAWVFRVQNLPNGIVSALQDTGWGLVRHEGGAPGGNQLGKTHLSASLLLDGFTNTPLRVAPIQTAPVF